MLELFGSFFVGLCIGGFGYTIYWLLFDKRR